MSNGAQMDAFHEGREAFKNKVPFRDCPYPAPLNPPRDEEDTKAAKIFDSLGAFWLDGWEEAEREHEELRTNLLERPSP